MMTAWKGTDYAEADRGKFDAWFLRYNYNTGEYMAIAYTDYDVVKITEDCAEVDMDMVREFAEQYDLPIEK